MTASGRDWVPAGRHPVPSGEEDKWLLPVLRMILVIGVSGRDWLAVCRTIGCREQPISAQGCLERVLQTATQPLPLTGMLPDYRISSKHDFYRIQTYRFRGKYRSVIVPSNTSAAMAMLSDKVG